MGGEGLSPANVPQHLRVHPSLRLREEHTLPEAFIRILRMKNQACPGQQGEAPEGRIHSEFTLTKELLVHTPFSEWQIFLLY